MSNYDWENVGFEYMLLPAGLWTPGRIGGHPRFAVLHHAVAFTIEQIYAAWTGGRQTSAHYGVQDGRVVQFVHDKDTAWATGNNTGNAQGISIEHVNSQLAPDYPVSDATFNTGARLVAALHRYYGWGRPTRATVKAHQEFSATACPGPYLMANLDRYIALAAAMYDGQDPAPAPAPTQPAPAPAPAPAAGQPHVTYQARTQKHGWLPPVTDLADYAGWENSPITDVAMSVSEGTVEYQVHELGGGWLPKVTGFNLNDPINGYAGAGRPIDAIRAYLHSPGRNKVIEYRTAAPGGDYYPWQRDDETTNGQDGYAGALGRPIGRVQAHITAH
ncbi:MAG: N-acetylmuramoyl-L-alanine amidase [Propionibacteriaceae bacterium]|jgi:hypothetical protein|nr:N-acetylmuramoyl-L-alanine amidase [Propionibacteriaceae bacterium]